MFEDCCPLGFINLQGSHESQNDFIRVQHHCAIIQFTEHLMELNFLDQAEALANEAKVSM